ncbi:MAG: SOS response-associated peptidase [Anaerolineales bacterium]|nr:SOS response-associated peptidase [Anaerolineales bacterium]MCB8953102.1 SOS response-associated peptidase [Ardenticatenales bacterium]
MCGRFTLAAATEDVAAQFALAEMPPLAPRYNIAPTQPVAVVRVAANGQRELTYLHWGLIPSWAKDPGMGARMINARAETVAEKPSFRAAFRYRRCLVPASGFYEWRKLNGKKQPMYIMARDGGVWGIAGIWERWIASDGSEVESCAILTTEPNELLRPIHNRMPLIIPPEQYTAWLDPHSQRPDMVQPLLQPYPAANMSAYPVSTLVNSPFNDSPDCIQIV